MNANSYQNIQSAIPYEQPEFAHHPLSASPYRAAHPSVLATHPEHSFYDPRSAFMPMQYTPSAVPWQPPQQPAHSHVPNMIPAGPQYTSAAMTWRPTAQDYTTWDPTSRYGVVYEQLAQAANVPYGFDLSGARSEPAHAWFGQYLKTPENESGGLDYVKSKSDWEKPESESIGLNCLKGEFEEKRGGGDAGYQE